MKLLNRKVGKTGRKSGFVPAFLFSTDFTPFRVVRVFRGQPSGVFNHSNEA